MLKIASHSGNADQTTVRYDINPLRAARLKMKRSVGKIVGTVKPTHVAGGNASWFSCCGNHQNVRYSVLPRDDTPRYIPHRTKARDSERCLHASTQDRIISNGPKVEVTSLSVNR